MSRLFLLIAIIFLTLESLLTAGLISAAEDIASAAAGDGEAAVVDSNNDEPPPSLSSQLRNKASSPAQFQDFLAHFLHHGYLSAPEVDATEEFKNHCVQPHGDRLHVFKPLSGKTGKMHNHHHHDLTDDAEAGTFRKGSAFLATDLCAMGHTAKDAPLLLSWALDAESFMESEMMKEAFDHYCDLDSTGVDAATVDCVVPSHRREEQAEVSHKKQQSPPLRYILYGNMCMCRDPAVSPNKRSPVFHSVLWGWFRAVTERISLLRRKRAEKNNQQKKRSGRMSDAEETEAGGGIKIEEIFMTGDFVNFNGGGNTAKFKTMCFENIVVRKENWRWVRDTFHADQFRIALWSHFQVSDANQVAKMVMKKPQFLSPADSSSSSSLAASADFPLPVHAFADAMLDALRPSLHNRNARFAAIDKLPLDQRLQKTELVHSLRSRFPSSLLPLRVTVLVRDEDRHFYEPAVGHFIQHAFGTDLVDVRLQKFDKVKNNNKKKKGSISHQQPPSLREQLQILYDTDLLVAAHGAGLAAVLAMRPGTAVVEFFPHNFKYYMYEEAAQLSRVHYRRYESPQVWPKRCCKPNRRLYKSNFSRPMHLNGLGARACKGCDTWVETDVVEELVAEAIRKVLLAHN